MPCGPDRGQPLLKIGWTEAGTELVKQTSQHSNTRLAANVLGSSNKGWPRPVAQLIERDSPPRIVNDQNAVLEHLGSQQGKPTVVRDDLKWNPLAEPLDIAEVNFQSHPRAVGQDSFRLGK